MKSSGELDINVYMKAYLFSEITNKLRTMIRYNEVRSVIFLIEFCESDMIYTDSIDFLYKHKCDIFKKAIHNNHHIDADFSVNVDE